METKRFKYSASQVLFGMTALPFLIIISYMEIITNGADASSWLLFGFVSAIIGLRFIYLSIIYYIPCLRDKTALEFDEEKLQCFINGWLLFQKNREVIYWKDVQEIDCVNPRSGSLIITFVMTDGGDDAGISTKYIAGNDKAIYNSIIEYYGKRQ